MKRGTPGGSSIRVASARTGIPVDTLRVWERRYGFPKPARRAGGSRIYAEADIARLQVIASALELGLRPGDVIALGQEELEALVRATRRDANAVEPTRPSRPEGPTLASLSDPGPSDATDAASHASFAQILTALGEDDVVGLHAHLRAAAVTLGPRRFVTDLAHPLAVRVGELWASGRLDIRHEHLASAALSTQLRLLLGAFDPTAQAPDVVLTTLPGEPHTLGLEMVAVYLATRSASPRLLGADLPPEQIAEAARAMRADAVGIAVSPAALPERTSEDARTLVARLPRDTELWVGGGGANTVALRRPRVRHVLTWAALDDAIAAVRATTAA